MPYDLMMTPLPDRTGAAAAAPPALLPMLELSVRMRLSQLDDRAVDHLRGRHQELAEKIASEADNVMFRSKKKGRTAESFNALAEAIALLSLQPAGVPFLGYRWQARPTRRAVTE